MHTPRAHLILLAVSTLVLTSSPASAALDIFNIPILKNIDGPVVWMSGGWIRGHDEAASTGEYFRGGLGIRYHTQKSTGEYKVKLTTVERDSSGGNEVKSKAVYTYEEDKKSGPVSVTVGYAVDNGPRLSTEDFSVRLPLKGPYVGVFVVPEWLAVSETHFFFGGTVAFLEARETSVHIDNSVALKINSSQAVVPEGFVGVSHKLSKLVVGFIEFSWQYARLQSIGYDKAGLSEPPSPALVDRLPRSASFHAKNITIGMTFSRI